MHTVEPFVFPDVFHRGFIIMLHILDLIDYWRDQLERARHEHDKPRAIVCGAMLWALGVRKGETFKTA